MRGHPVIARRSRSNLLSTMGRRLLSSSLKLRRTSRLRLATTFSTILLVGFAASAAEGPQSSPTARGLCNDFLGIVGRVVPAPDDIAPMRKRVQNTVAQMQAIIRADEGAQRADQNKDSGASPLKAMGDGHGVHYHSGGDGAEGGNTLSDQYAQLKQRLAAIAPLLESGAATSFEIEDPSQIQDFSGRLSPSAIRRKFRRKQRPNNGSSNRHCLTRKRYKGSSKRS